jgi:methionine-rich copper-binding protein CopC
MKIPAFLQTSFGKFVLAILPWICAAPYVYAHVGLAKTVPDHDQVMEQAPTKIVFQFMAQVTITNLRLERTREPRVGERIEVRLPRNSIGQSTAFGDNIVLDLPALEPGAYLVTYQAVSIGGDVLVDDFAFSVVAPQLPVPQPL